MNILKFFKKKEEQETKDTSQETYADILISLNKDLEINLSVFIDCNYNKHGIGCTDYAELCSKLINFDHIKLKNQIIDILKHQIKNQENQYLINTLIPLIENHIKESKLDQTEKIYDNFFIKPSQVFTKHIHEHQ